MKALKVFKTVYGDKHLDIAQVYNNLGEAYLSLGKNKEALQTFSEAFIINKETLGEDDPETILVEQNLKQLSKQLGLEKYN